jgi:hypothetical protein
LAENQSDWVRSKMSDWAAVIHKLSLVANCYLQLAYQGLQKSLQQEWQFLKHVTNGLGGVFHRVAEALSTRFLHALFSVPDTDIALWQLGYLLGREAGFSVTA